MALRREPTARQLRLAAELRRLRVAAGLTARQAAAELGVSPVQISHIESALAGVSEERLRRMAANYACTDTDLIDALAAMATERVRGWWEDFRGLLPASYLDLAELEHHARFRGDVAVMHVPGLFQTEQYAQALFAYMSPELSDAEVARRVSHRMRRKVVIERADPIPYETVIHEAALRIRVTGRAASRAQLTRILEMSEADHVTVRVIPFELDGFAGAGSTMVHLGGPVPRLDTVVRDAPHGTAFIDSEEELAHFKKLFHRVRERSLSPERSRDLIHQVAKQM